MRAQRCYSAFKLGDMHHNRFAGIWLNLNEVVIVYEMSIKSWLPSSPLLDALEKAVRKVRYTSTLGFPKELLGFFCFGFWYLVWEERGLEQKSWPCKQIKTILEFGTTLLNPSKLKKNTSLADSQRYLRLFSAQPSLVCETDCYPRLGPFLFGDYLLQFETLQSCMSYHYRLLHIPIKAFTWAHAERFQITLVMIYSYYRNQH